MSPPSPHKSALLVSRQVILPMSARLRLRTFVHIHLHPYLVKTSIRGLGPQGRVSVWAPEAGCLVLAVLVDGEA
jgi:hypothetical protein